MSPLRQSLNDYLALRRAMGFKLQAAHTLLPHFLAFLEQHHATVITTAWAM